MDKSFFDVVTSGASWRRWLIILPSWLVVAVLFASQTVVHYQSAGRPVSWWAAYQGSAIYCLIWAIFTPGILYLAERFPIERKRAASRLFSHLSISILIALIQQTVFTLYEIECPMLPMKAV